MSVLAHAVRSVHCGSHMRGRHIRSLVSRVAVGGLLVIGGCTSIIDGDTTDGDEGQSRWGIDDGLCPGIGGSCNLDVPVAVGAAPRLDVFTDCCNPGRLDVVAVGDAEVVEQRADVEDRRIDAEVRVDGPGEIRLELRDDTEVIDTVTLEAREATSMECGVVRGSADWQMSGLDIVEISTETPERRRVQLGCRLLDADGEPLLSVAAIRWRIVEGPEGASIDTGSSGDRRNVGGARIYFNVDTSGDTGLLEASYRDLSQTLEITVLDD